MAKQENNIIIPIGQKQPGEYLTDLHGSISDLLKMLFERRELDLREEECFALFVLIDFQKRLMGK